MWNGLKDICEREGVGPSQLCTVIANGRADGKPLTSSIRVFIMNYYRNAATEEGHRAADHGQGYMKMIAPTHLSAFAQKHGLVRP